MIEKQQTSFNIDGTWYRASSPDHFFSFFEREDVTDNVKRAFRQYKSKYPNKVEAQS